MAVLEITSFRGGFSDFEDKGPAGSFKFASNLDIRKKIDSISAGQALKDIGSTLQSASPSISPSSSFSPSSSPSPSPSLSISPSASASPSSPHPSSSLSPSASVSPSASSSPSASISPSSSISSSPSPSAGIKSTFSDLGHTFVKCSDGNLYSFGDTGKIYKIKQDLSVTQVYDVRKPITGAAEKPSSGGKIYLLFATTTEVHRKEIPGNVNWNDVNAAGSVQGDTWPKTNLDYNLWHTMVNVDGDILIANDNKLAMAAYDDSYTNEALDLIPGNSSKTLLERNGRAVVGTVSTADPTIGINGAVDTEVPVSQVGINGNIFYSDFVNSLPIKILPGGGKVNPGGMTHQYDLGSFFDWESNALSWIDKKILRNMVLMGVYGATPGKGGIYTYGRLDKNHPFALNLEYQFDADEIGAVISAWGYVFCSYRIGSQYGIKVTDPLTKATGIYESLDFRAPVKTPANITAWKYAEVYMKPLPAGCSVEFWYRADKNGNFIQAKTNGGATQFNTAGAEKAVFSVATNGEIYEKRVVTNPSGNQTAEIYRLRTYFQ